MKRYFSTQKLLLFFVLLLSTTIQIIAQDAPVKFGKIDPKELQSKVYEKDSSAEAVVLADFCEVSYTYNSSTGSLKLNYERVRRVKILKKSGYDYATFSIPMLQNKNRSARDYVDALKGATYNWVDGKMVTEKLNKEGIFDDKKSDNYTVKKVTMNGVKEGSIVEISYRLISDFDSEIRGWEFQEEIPTVWSEYRVQIPNFYQFRMINQGYEPLVVNEITPANFNLGGGESFPGTSYRFAVKDAPSIREEPFITTIDDYNNKIEFELAATRFPNQMEKYYSITWADFGKTLMEYERVGKQLKSRGFMKDIAENIKKTAKDAPEKLAAAYQYIQKTMTWNDDKGFFVTESLRKAHEIKTGNVADINMMLIALLRELDITADPVVLSTRSHGRVLDSYVLERKFNYVIAQVTIGEQKMLLDATEPLLKMGSLPQRCLNGQGRLVNEFGGEWVDLKSTDKQSRTVVMNLAMDAEGQMKGDVTISHQGYAAHGERGLIRKDKKDKYLENFKKKRSLWKISKLDLENIDDADQPLVTKCEALISETSNVAGDRIYLKPMLGEGEDENPFKNPTRNFPVDLASPIEEYIVGSYAIPEGYVVEELPKSVKVSLPDDGGKFTFIVSKSEDGSKIGITSKINIKKTVFFTDEYELIKNFFDQIVQKHAEQIVLKKK
jgi:hypothetical protein